MWLFNVYDVIIMGNKMTLTETATLLVATLTVEDVLFSVEIRDVSGQKVTFPVKNVTVLAEIDVFLYFDGLREAETYIHLF